MYSNHGILSSMQRRDRAKGNRLSALWIRFPRKRSQRSSEKRTMEVPVQPSVFVLPSISYSLRLLDLLFIRIGTKPLDSRTLDCRDGIVYQRLIMVAYSPQSLCRTSWNRHRFYPRLHANAFKRSAGPSYRWNPGCDYRRADQRPMQGLSEIRLDGFNRRIAIPACIRDFFRVAFGFI
jgi:hypothetical protein